MSFQHVTPVELITLLWRDLVQERFDATEFAQAFIHDCGVDAGDLTVADILALLAGAFHGDWNEVQFACDEVLAGYSSGKLSNTEFVRAVFAAMALAKALHASQRYWEDYHFDKACQLIVRNTELASLAFSFDPVGFRVAFFRRLLCD